MDEKAFRETTMAENGADLTRSDRVQPIRGLFGQKAFVEQNAHSPALKTDPVGVFPFTRVLH